MGKKKKEKSGKIKLFSKKEREAKISTILMQMATMDLENIISLDLRQILQQWIDTGETVEKDISLQQYGRTMLIRLYDNKKMGAYINLKYNKVKVNDKRLSEMQDMTEEGKMKEDWDKLIETGDMEQLEKIEKMIDQNKI